MSDAMSDPARVFAGIVGRRRSIRAFRPEPAPRELLESVFSVALRAPSNCNTQPWQAHVASGQKLETLRERLPAEFAEGRLSMDFPYDGAYQGVYRQRQLGAAQALYEACGIERSDKPARHAQFMRNFSFFDAPHVAFLFLPEPFGLREACDLGMYAQSLMLSMVAHGLGCCPQTALSMQCDTVREVLEVDSSNRLLFGISFGYAREDAPANQVRTERGALRDIVRFHC